MPIKQGTAPADHSCCGGHKYLMEQTEFIQIGGAGPASLVAAITLAKAGRPAPCEPAHEAQDFCLAV